MNIPYLYIERNTPIKDIIEYLREVKGIFKEAKLVIHDNMAED